MAARARMDHNVLTDPGHLGKDGLLGGNVEGDAIDVELWKERRLDVMPTGTIDETTRTKVGSRVESESKGESGDYGMLPGHPRGQKSVA